jgi:hypothetical protein
MTMGGMVTDTYTYIGPLEDPGIPDPEPTAQPAWLGDSYSYAGDAPHAVTSVERYQAAVGSITDSYTGVHPELAEGTATAT